MSATNRTSIRLHRVLLFCLLLVPFCAANDYKYEDTRHDARDFVNGGTLHLRLKVGDVHIRRGETAQIRLQYTIKSAHEQNLKEVTVDFDVHGNDANIEFHAPLDEDEAREILRDSPGVVVVDKREPGGYITPIECAGEFPVYVSRIRKDPTVEHGLNLWCVSDNLRKGAALNAVQIAQLLHERGLLERAPA